MQYISFENLASECPVWLYKCQMLSEWVGIATITFKILVNDLFQCLCKH